MVTTLQLRYITDHPTRAQGIIGPMVTTILTALGSPDSGVREPTTQDHTDMVTVRALSTEEDTTAATGVISTVGMVGAGAAANCAACNHYRAARVFPHVANT
jgi:hypothetical protein